jgi:hypothetical protein
MSRPKTDDIDPRAIAASLWRDLGGKAGIAKWGKTHRSLAYQLISKLMAQPVVQVNNNNNVNVNSEQARAKFADALMRVIAARRAAVGDPAVYVDGERLTEPRPPDPAVYVNGQRLIESPWTDVVTPGTRDDGDASGSSGSNSSELKSPKKGPLFSPGGDLTRAPAGAKKENVYSNSRPSVPGLYAGAAFDESSDTRSTTEKYLTWSGHGRPP